MSDPNDYTIGWICAIKVEYVAAQAFLDEKHDEPEAVSPHDNNDYTLWVKWESTMSLLLSYPAANTE